jgi:formate dehydrogenase assembly factor FdhD
MLLMELHESISACGNLELKSAKKLQLTLIAVARHDSCEGYTHCMVVAIALLLYSFT